MARLALSRQTFADDRRRLPHRAGSEFLLLNSISFCDRAASGVALALAVLCLLLDHPNVWLYRYHWVSEFAPASAQKYLSYMTGWLTIIGWQSAITGIGMLIAGNIQGLAILNNPYYTPERWHSTLITIAVVAVCMGFNTVLARKLPLVECSLAVMHFGGLFVVMIVL